VFVNTTHVGCTSPNAYNYVEEATIDNSSCIENLSTSVVSYDPLCTDEYGSALIYVTGGVSPYESTTTYISYSPTGVLSADIPIEFNEEGIAHLSGLDGGEYVIEIHDNSIVVTLDTFNIVMPLGIEVEAHEEDGLLTSTIVLGEPVLYQWLFIGESIEGATDEIHCPQEFGTYQVYVEDELGCGYYSNNEPADMGIKVEVVEEDGLLTSTVVVGEPVIYQWLFEGEFIEGATNIIHDAQSSGMYQVYVENELGCGDYSDNVEVAFIGIEEFSDYSFTLHPNPAHSSITLSLDQLNAKTTVSFTDVLGQELHKLILDSRSSVIDYTFDISEFPSGLYFISVINNSNQIVKRFVKN